MTPSPPPILTSFCQLGQSAPRGPSMVHGKPFESLTVFIIEENIITDEEAIFFSNASLPSRVTKRYSNIRRNQGNPHERSRSLRTSLILLYNFSLLSTDESILVQFPPKHHRFRPPFRKYRNFTLGSKKWPSCDQEYLTRSSGHPGRLFFEVHYYSPMTTKIKRCYCMLRRNRSLRWLRDSRGTLNRNGKGATVHHVAERGRHVATLLRARANQRTNTLARAS